MPTKENDFPAVAQVRKAVRDGIGERGLTARAPWLVAFIFGLLHGFGFAGALAEVGLPDGHIPTALLFFNIGVELGQLAFIGTVLVVAMIARKVRSVDGVRQRVTRVAPYLIGSLAAFWFVERVAAFASP
jgi:hypothetical protein